VKLKLYGKKIVGHGKLYLSQRKKDSTGKLNRVRVLKHTSPGYQRDPASDILIRCECIKTGRPFRFIGSISAYHENESTCTAIQEHAPRVETEELIETQVQKSERITRPTARPRAGAELRLEMEQIVAQRMAGIDPLIKLKHVCVLVNESKPTLYRKMKISKFPRPTKRGHQSFWRLSQIEAYVAGPQSDFQFTAQSNLNAKLIFKGNQK